MTELPMPTPEYVMRRFRPTLALTCLLGCLSVARADDPIDSVMYREPAPGEPTRRIAMWPAAAGSAAAALAIGLFLMPQRLWDLAELIVR